jgi:Radical SAM superfamily
MRRPRILLYAPTLYELGFKQHHIDGEALALYAHLKREGYDCVFLDAYYRAVAAPSLADAISRSGGVDVIVVHLWTSDAYGPRLRVIADELASVRRAHAIPVAAFGPLAISAATELRAHGAIDHAIGLAGRQRLPTTQASSAAAVAASIARYLQGHTPLTALSDGDLPYLADAVVSVSASRGCFGRCTFCAYNADLGGGWLELPVTDVVADIAHLHRLTGATRFAFADSDFGGTPRACQRRARQLAGAVAAEGLAGRLSLSINVRSETLDPAAVRLLAGAGVRTMLIGVESFNDETLHRLYGKRQDLAHLTEIARAADGCGVTTVASYILWHPWQTMPSIRRELDAIEEFGRYRIAQFMARSRLLVIPGTVIEQKVRAAGLLDARPFERRFRFADAAARRLCQDLTDWFGQTAMPVLTGLAESRPGDLTALAELKIAEWRWLTAQAGLAGAVHG